jgi:hypothetical protein
MQDESPTTKPTLDELEKILNSENDWEDNTIEILPNGEIRKNGKGQTPRVLTMRENLGGEYGSEI